MRKLFAALQRLVQLIDIRFSLVGRRNTLRYCALRAEFQFGIGSASSLAMPDESFLARSLASSALKRPTNCVEPPRNRLSNHRPHDHAPFDANFNDPAYILTRKHAEFPYGLLGQFD